MVLDKELFLRAMEEVPDYLRAAPDSAWEKLDTDLQAAWELSESYPEHDYEDAARVAQEIADYSEDEKEALDYSAELCAAGMQMYAMGFEPATEKLCGEWISPSGEVAELEMTCGLDDEL